jgi:general secretion pathway protein H
VRGRGRAGGFTVIEILVVMVIIGIGVGLAVPMIEAGFDAREVRRAARQIASSMHHCRNEAMSKGEPQELVIDIDRNMIATTDWGKWAQLTDRAVIERALGGNILGDGAVQILCYPNGASSGADVVVASRRDRTRERLRILFDPLIGRVEVGDASS